MPTRYFLYEISLYSTTPFFIFSSVIFPADDTFALTLYEQKVSFDVSVRSIFSSTEKSTA